MSACFDLAVIGALLKQLWIVIIISPSSYCFGSSICVCFMLFLLCWLWQRFNLLYQTVSMSLKPTRVYSGIQSFQPFHIKRFSFLFLFLRVRVDLT